MLTSANIQGVQVGCGCRKYLVQGKDNYFDSSMSTPSLSALCSMNCRI